jgi:hypothetical protein
MFTQHFYSRFIKLTLLILLIVLETTSSYSQLRPRTSEDSILAGMNGYWYRPVNYQFETQYPKLTYIPPITITMPTEIGIAYYLLDTLMKSIPICDFLERARYWKKNSIKNDTTTTLIKYLYKIVDYNPVSFNQYMHNLDDDFYKSHLNPVHSTIEELLSKLVPNFPLHYAMMDLINADYILKVHVNSVTSLPWIEYPNKKVRPNEYVYQVNATVLDTLKGKVFQNCNSPQSLVVKKSGLQLQSNDPFICFNYVTGPYTDVLSNNSRIIDRSLQDTTENQFSQNLKLSPGQDLIIFISYDNYLWDYNYDYFDLSINTVIPIIDGQVIDDNYEWSNSKYLNYNDWKNAFQQKVNMLLNGGY